MILNPHSSHAAKYPISMIDAISKGLQGLFVAMVFFSDPAMTEFIKNQCISYKQKYVDDFSQVKYTGGQVEVIPPSPTSLIIRPSPAFLASETPLEDDVTLDWDPNNSKHQPLDSRIIPMRRLSVSPSVYSRIYHLQQHQGDHYITPPITPTNLSFIEGSTRSSQSVTIPNTDHRVLVPYKYPRFASVVHWTLLRCGFKPSSEVTITVQKDSSARSSSITAIVNIPPETSTTHLA
jgi:hypothetical protein